jgi:S1-C subfamily serine protease
MKPIRYFPLAFVVVLCGALSPARADNSVADVAEQVNKKMVKLWGSGGLKGLASYGTGFFVSKDGYILTVYSHILETPDLRVHLPNGDKYHAKVVCTEPELDIALVKLDTKEKIELKDDEFFDVEAASKRPLVEVGTTILGFSNEFEIAERDEPTSVMQGSIASYSKLYGRIGIHEASYTGNVYVLDAITNNPGAGGGVITNRKGELLGIIGKELRNELTNTWINYAVPIGSKVVIRVEDEMTKKVEERELTILKMVEEKEKYKPAPMRKKEFGGGYTGIVLVPNPVERTPPYVEDVAPGSPAEKAGLKPDDLIVYVNGFPVISINAYKDTIETYRPGETVKLEVRRGDKLTTVTLKLDAPKKVPVVAPKDGPAKDK